MSTIAIAIATTTTVTINRRWRLQNPAPCCCVRRSNVATEITSLITRPCGRESGLPRHYPCTAETGGPRTNVPRARLGRRLLEAEARLVHGAVGERQGQLATARVRLVGPPPIDVLVGRSVVLQRPGRRRVREVLDDVRRQGARACDRLRRRRGQHGEAEAGVQAELHGNRA